VTRTGFETRRDPYRERGASGHRRGKEQVDVGICEVKREKKRENFVPKGKEVREGMKPGQPGGRNSQDN
jgi:hypothetical protein